MKSIKWIAIAILVNAAPALMAQTPSPRIDAAQLNQATRINQGVKSGALTSRETKILRGQQRQIAAEKGAFNADGKFTRAERAAVKSDQRKASRAIYRKKHDANTVK